MANELGVTLVPNRTVVALIWGPDRRNRWTGSTMTSPDDITDVDWETGFIFLTEQLTYDNTRTGRYTGNFPAIATPGEYEVEYYYNVTTPGAGQPVASQQIDWKGNGTVSLPNISESIATVYTSANNTYAAVVNVANDVRALPSADTIAEAVLLKAVDDVDDHTMPPYSLGTIICAMLNSSISNGVWVIKNPAGDTICQPSVDVDPNAAPITGVH